VKKANDQTEQLKRARWEFLKRDMKRFDDFMQMPEIQSFVEWLKQHPDMGDLDECLKDSIQIDAVVDGTGILFKSWFKVLRKLLDAGTHPLLCEDKDDLYKEQVLADSKEIIQQLTIFETLGQTMIVSVNLDRPKHVIMAEFEAILNRCKTTYQTGKNRIFEFDANMKFSGITIEKDQRAAWLSKTDELLEVWDMYGDAGQQPGKRTFEQISMILKRPVSTVKDQWRVAYQKIYGKPYDPEMKYSTEEKKADADQLCAKCPYGAKCYRGDDWYPCPEYLQRLGRERTLNTVEYREDLLFSNEEPIDD
jgi:hypothetical protein